MSSGATAASFATKSSACAAPSRTGGRRIEARACVLAAGGFESNREWLREAWGQNERGEWPADNFLIRGTAYNQGVAQADLAVDTLVTLGLTFTDTSGSIVYYDIEYYGNDSACRAAVNASPVSRGWSVRRTR